MLFSENVQALMAQYGDNLSALVYDSTERIFYLRKNQNNEFRQTGVRNMVIGKFYLIQYNYNGNRIFAPIMPLEYKVNNNKNILYAVNLDYLPYKYKVDFFSKIFSFYESLLEKNQDLNKVMDELPMKGVNFETVYKYLKGNGGFEYAVTAYDLQKIIEVNVVSTNIMHRFIFLNTRMVNSATMKEMLSTTDSDELMVKIKEIVERYDAIRLSYDQDTKYFYKRLRSFEQNFKLVENI